ncbi:MAG TPA: glycosyltransferase family 4 protein [Ktedonobacteraceae bacterium]|jgi:glycosyltransferase involved in cell wall biosynthesis
MTQKRPRIRVVITTFLPYVGGAETQTLAQCQRLLEKGYDVQVITFCHDAAWPRQEEIRGVPTQRVAGFLLGNRNKLPRLLQRLLYLPAMLVMSWTTWRQRKEFDVLQVCQCGSIVLPLAMICLLMRKPMTIVLISAGAEKATKSNEPARLLAGPLDPSLLWLKVADGTWIDGDLYGLQSAGPLAFNLTRALLKHLQASIIVLSNRMKHYLQKNAFDLPGTVCISNGVDTNRFRPVTPQLQGEDHAHTVVCVSKLRYEKGIDVLLQAWRLVHAQVPEARLLLIGNGPLEEQLKQLTDALGIRANVEFAGLKSDIPEQLHRAAISVLPSRWEGMPNALLEAMACGLACVATQVSGSEDIIQHGFNGLLVETENYEQMAQALILLLRDPQLVREYGAQARQTIERHYTLDYITNQYVEVYQRAIAQKQHSTKKLAAPETKRAVER